MRIAVAGTGYVGLVAGVCFADSGHFVVCVDVDEKKIALLRQGHSPIYEPGLDELLAKNTAAERLTFSTDLAAAVKQSEVVFIAVGTPQADSGDADLRAAMGVAMQIAAAAERYTVVVNKSTVPVGTAARMQAEINARAAGGVQIDVVSNPEFLKEGAAIDDFMRPDRIVVGASSERARAIMGELYAPFVRTESPIYFMDPRSSELTKYAANAMLATRISFMNEVAALCERVGADVDSVRKAMGSDERIGQKFLFPGCGYGGSCFPKDVKALIATARNNGLDFTLLSAVDAVNDRQKRLLAQKAKVHFGDGGLRGKKVGVWGLAFKPKTDDLRQAPALALIEELLADGAVIAAHDPVAIENARGLYGDRVTFVHNPYVAAEGADALFLVTEWNEFRQPDFARVKASMKQPVLFDGRNIWNPQRLREMGFTYYGVGRGSQG
ncbi:MAG TPA: UDP-glucose/GDP-mannose dehydrogenase family protein [Myxococcales bacterium]|nr:UDP-glucose/GDP-mannose dehydrogenase family protein [Myxococcales bacterium]